MTSDPAILAALSIEVIYEPLLGDDIGDVARRGLRSFWERGAGVKDVRLVIPDFNGVRITMERVK